MAGNSESEFKGSKYNIPHVHRSVSMANGLHLQDCLYYHLEDTLTDLAAYVNRKEAVTLLYNGMNEFWLQYGEEVTELWKDFKQCQREIIVNVLGDDLVPQEKRVERHDYADLAKLSDPNCGVPFQIEQVIQTPLSEHYQRDSDYIQRMAQEEEEKQSTLESLVLEKEFHYFFLLASVCDEFLEKVFRVDHKKTILWSIYRCSNCGSTGSRKSPLRTQCPDCKMAVYCNEYCRHIHKDEHEKPCKDFLHRQAQAREKSLNDLLSELYP